MIKRAILGAGLGMALLAGGFTATHTTGAAAAPQAAVHSDLKVLSTSAQVVDPDPTAACAVDASGVETGDCQNSQNATGPEDSAAVSEADTTE
jgi:hypothetical protein